ncbi:MAG: SMC-Scp complex subunit ScpB [Candidatus Omnitrophica bacterium]|nr:SMC-Scp complex subunit ScpB [Candidatus Omnitrophota bacterium]
MELQELKRALEAFLFVSSEPVQIAHIKDILGVEDITILQKAIGELKKKYEGNDSGLRLIEIAGGYRLGTVPELAPYVKKLFKREKPRLSRASLETLSIIAYRQPVTRSDVEAIRGVNVEGALTTLLERGLVRIAGRRETVGRPILYGTTRLFLEHFGLNTLRELPPLNEYSEHDLTEEERQELERLPGKGALPVQDNIESSGYAEGNTGELDRQQAAEHSEGKEDEKSKEIAQEDRPD